MAGNGKQQWTRICAFGSAILWFCTLVPFAVLYFSEAVPIRMVRSLKCEAPPSPENCSQQLDVINVAVQLGRLDFVTFGLTILGTAIALLAVFAYLAIRERAELVASHTADQWMQHYTDNKLQSEVFRAIQAGALVFSQSPEDDDATDIGQASGENDER